MNLQQRVNFLVQLGAYLSSDEKDWQAAKQKAEQKNPWFIQPFIDLAVKNIVQEFLQEEKLYEFAESAHIPLRANTTSKQVGIVMAGNIPLVGFHDWLCVFLSGNQAVVKLSEKDNVLMAHLLEELKKIEPGLQQQTQFADLLIGCDAYIATGSNNTARYFDYYFGKYPSIIRRNRTSVAILDGTETEHELELLADDVHLFFGLGCRNVTQLRVPEGYDFVPLLEQFKKYNYFSEHHKYKNNYDYQLALLLLNNQFYMANGSLLLSAQASVFSAISQLHYQFIPALPSSKEHLDDLHLLKQSADIQCIVGHGLTPFGKAQQPGLFDFADRVNTLEFLSKLAP
jgi:hypothetical protein